MRTRTTITALAAAGLLALTGCASEDPDTGSTTPDTSQTSDAIPDDDGGAAPADEESATLPDMTGKGLQAAQDEAQAAGFYALTSSDASGAGRMQVFDRSWKVCSQTPEAGEHPVDTQVEFATVKLSESC